MIVFDLGCENDHRFEGWFSSSEDFERQQREHLLTCPMCGDQTISRLVTAARVNTGRSEPPTPTMREQATAAQYANFDSARMLKLIPTLSRALRMWVRRFPRRLERFITRKRLSGKSAARHRLRKSMHCVTKEST